MAAAVKDREAPVIRSMPPYDGSLTGTSITVKVLAVDNAMVSVSTVTIEYAKADSDEIFTTLASWYFNNIIKKFEESNCPIDYIKFEEYAD